MAGVETKAFQVEKKDGREDTLNSNNLFNELVSKTQNYSEDHKKVGDLVANIESKLADFKQKINSGVQVGEKNMIGNFSESKFDTSNNGQKVLEHNFDKSMSNLANRLNEITSKFNGNYEVIQAQLGQLLDSDAFINSLPKEKSFTESLANKLGIKSNPGKPVIESKTDSFQGGVDTLKQGYYNNNRTEKALRDAGV
ncbi:MAG: hypothetical protein PHV23_05940 [Candidatus Gracilibacteria bacterium]|nr:hypothetical protein [Candidatus Gracilibacteria bacterium]